MGFNLDKLTNELFIEAKQAFKKAGASVTIDQKDPANPVLVAALQKSKSRNACEQKHYQNQREGIRTRQRDC